MNIIIATYKKNRMVIKRAMPWSFMFSRITGGVSAIVFPFFIYTFFLSKNLNQEFSLYTNSADYMTYIVLGSSLNVLAVATLMNIGRALITEQRQGTLEPFILSPASRIAYFIGCLAEQTSRALVEFAVVIVVGAILGAELSRIFCIDSLITILLAVLSFFCLGLFLSSVMLYTRDTYITQNTLFNVMTLCCGVIYPIEYLPKWLQYIAQIFPLTPSVKLFRIIVIGQGSLQSNYNLIIHIAVLCVAYAIIGVKWYRKIEKTLVENVFV